MSWNNMSPGQGANHIVDSCVKFVRLVASIFWLLLFLMAMACFIIKVLDPTIARYFPPPNESPTGLIVGAIVVLLLCYYIGFKPTKWIYGTRHDVLNPDDWKLPAVTSTPAPRAVPRYARPRRPIVTCPYCGTINRHNAHYCGEGQVRGCGGKL